MEFIPFAAYHVLLVIFSVQFLYHLYTLESSDGEIFT